MRISIQGQELSLDELAHYIFLVASDLQPCLPPSVITIVGEGGRLADARQSLVYNMAVFAIEKLEKLHQKHGPRIDVAFTKMAADMLTAAQEADPAGFAANYPGQTVEQAAPELGVALRRNTGRCVFLRSLLEIIAEQTRPQAQPVTAAQNN